MSAGDAKAKVIVDVVASECRKFSDIGQQPMSAIVWHWIKRLGMAADAADSPRIKRELSEYVSGMRFNKDTGAFKRYAAATCAAWARRLDLIRWSEEERPPVIHERSPRVMVDDDELAIGRPVGAGW